jgi:hypothetical protein
MHGAREIELGEARSRRTRCDATSDVVIADRKARACTARTSRRRRDKSFVDHSSNGTWVTVGKTDQLAPPGVILRGRGGSASATHCRATRPRL